METRATKLNIDQELKSFIPPLKPEEYDLLEKNILHSGCIDALIAWENNGVLTLVDGHNRYEVCQQHNIPFKIHPKTFSDREEVKNWIIDHQLGRRNITKEQREYLLGLRYRQEKKSLGENQHNLNRVGQNVPPTSTAQKIAEQHGVSDRTVKRAEKFADGLDNISKVRPEMKQEILQGKSEINQGQVREFASILESVLCVEVEKRITEIEEEKRRKREKKEHVRELKRQENYQKVESAPGIPAGVYQTILIDPPWDWGDEGDVNQLGRAKPDYATMSIEQLKGLPVGEYADTNCHLYLWVTNRSLPKAFGLIEKWGFRYITCITWVKPSFGMGNYFRGSTEQLLFAVKGSQPIKRKDVGTHFLAHRGKRHSEKPAKVYDLIESCSYGPYLEMFSRNERTGWSMWGEDNTHV